MRENESQLRNKIAKAERARPKARAEREAREAARIREKTGSGEEKAPPIPRHRTSARWCPAPDYRPAGQAIWPVRGPLLHRFGDSIPANWCWKGMVIGAPEGTQVKAVADGGPAGRLAAGLWVWWWWRARVKGDMSLYGYNQSARWMWWSGESRSADCNLVGSSGGQKDQSPIFEIRRRDGRLTRSPGWGDSINSDSTGRNQKYLTDFVTFITSSLITFSAAAAQLAIVIDDFGYRKQDDNRIPELPPQVSIPGLPNSRSAKKCRKHTARAVKFIHMPMAPISKQPLKARYPAPVHECRGNWYPD